MRISAKADYAVRALVELGAAGGGPLTCEGLAASQQIPYRFLKAVLRDLRRVGLVRSQRGCEGGYWLGRPAEQIHLAEAVAAVDGDRPAVPDGPTSVVWRAIRARTEEILAGVTVADLLTETPAEPAAALLRPGRDPTLEGTVHGR